MLKFSKASFTIGIILTRLSRHLALLLLMLIAGRLSGHGALQQDTLIILAVVSVIMYQIGKLISPSARNQNSSRF